MLSPPEPAAAATGVNLFLCHAAEDARVALRLAKALEQSRYSTWHYQRDMLPGPSYLAQSGQAIDQADAFLLLISAASLASREVTTEIEHAHRRADARYIPILLGVPYTEIKARRPEWHTALGTAPAIDINVEDVRPTVARIVKALEHWKILPRLSRPPKLPPKPTTFPGKWASDANQIDIHDLKRVVFRNPIIDDFLEGKGKHFLSANKGLGKTLLLTYKRSYLTKESAQAASAFIPEGKPYLDFMSDVPRQSDNHEAFLANLANAKRLWALALRIAAVSYHPALVRDDDADELRPWPKRLAAWLRGDKVEPTVVFKEVLGYSLGDINRLLNERMNFLEQKFRQVHSPVFMFIDKVDQGIESLKRQAWIHVQAGLIEAAWDAMSANNHVKIYASIRQEAFANYKSNIKTNLHGATTVIQYSDADLLQLLDQLTVYYEKRKTFKELVSLNVVRTPHSAFPEDCFQYLNRHTLGRPRDLVIIASEFSRAQQTLTEPVYRRLVTDTSATVLVANIFDEMRVFLDCLRDEDDRLRFFALLPYNILTRQEAVRIYYEFNGLPPEPVEGYDFNARDAHHPFWELYSAGLLGVVVKDPDDGKLVQRFKLPHDTISDSPTALPKVEYCLIHPALNGLIRKHRFTGQYHLFQHILVGHGCPWESYDGVLREIERTLFDETDDALRDLAHAVLGEVTPLLHTGRRCDVAPALAASRNWASLRELLAERDRADLHQQIEALAPSGTR